MAEVTHTVVDQPTIVLLHKAQSGDTTARDQLLERYLPRLRRWASGRLPASYRTMRDTGDLVQEAIISALPHLPTLEIRTDAAFQDYLRRAIRNRIIDLHRSAVRRPSRAPLREDVVAREPSPLEQAIGAEALERYEAALDRLSDEEQQIIFLKVELGLSWSEIAEETGKPSPDAARVKATRALRRLADEMRRGRS